jgi:hypothetical protein
VFISRSVHGVLLPNPVCQGHGRGREPRILRTPAWQYPHRKQSSHQCAARLGLEKIHMADAFEKKSVIRDVT